MWIYLLCYFAVGLILYNIQNKKNKTDYIKIFVAIMLLTLLAAFRDETVGTDVLVYGKACYQASKHVHTMSGFMDFLFNNSNGIEAGYLFLVFCATKLFGSLSSVLFITNLFVNIGVICGLYRVRENISFDIAVLIYCFLFYQNTYNIMRQWLAIAAIMFGLKYIYEKKPLKYALTIIIAMFFHRTALVGAGLYLIYVILPKRNSVFVKTAIIGGIILFVVCFQRLTNVLISSGFMPMKYAHYSEGDAIGFSFSDTIIRIPPIALSILLYKQMAKINKNHEYWFLLLLIDLILAQLYSIMVYANRIAAYFTISRIFELSIACKIKKSNERLVVKILVIIYIVALWYVNYIYLGHGETYPYMSEILEIGIKNFGR